MGIATQIQDGLQFIESPLKINHLQGTTSTTILQVHKPAAGTPSLEITGNLTFDGDSRYIDLAKGTTNSQPFIRIGEQSLYGFSMRWDSGSHVQFDGWWNSTTGGSSNRDFGSLDVNNRIWKFEGSLTLNGNTVWHAGNDGASSGLDADLLDGNHASAFALSSHNHNNLYYLESESNAKFTSTDGADDDYTFEIQDEGSFSGNKWYHVSTINSANGGLHIRGAILNHVENFASQKLDLAIQVREANDGGQLEIAGTVDVLHNETSGSDKAGIRVVKTADNATYDEFKVYVRTTRYSQLTLRLTQQGSVTFNTSHGSPLTSEPAPVSGGHVEIDTSTYTEGSYTIVDSEPTIIAEDKFVQVHNRLQVGQAGDASNTGRLDLFGRYSNNRPRIYFKSDHPTNSTVWDMAQIVAYDGGNYNGQLYLQVASGTGTAGNAASLATAIFIDDTKDTTFYGELKMDGTTFIDTSRKASFDHLNLGGATGDGGEDLKVGGIRGRFASEHIQLYNKVGIGYPSGWNGDNSATPSGGLAVYGGAALAYNNGGVSIGQAYSSGDHSNTSLEVNGDVSFRAGSHLYFGQTTTLNSWKTKITSNNTSTMTINAQGLDVNNAGYASPAVVWLKANNTELSHKGNTIWHAGNDGAGTGLDADLLDGQHGSYFTNASNLGSGTLPVARLPEFIEEKYIYTSNDSNAVYLPMVKNGLYGTGSSSKTGQILIKLPSYKSNMMMQFYVDIYEYDTGESMTYRISGYNYNDTNATWYNTSVVNLSDDTDRDFTVRFGADTSNNFQYVAIGETDSVWGYPQINVRDFFGGFSTSESDALGSFDVSFVTSTPGSVSRTHDNNFPPSKSAKTWTTARTITLGGDLTGSVSLDGSADVTLSGQVVNNSHTHDDRYYTETESDGRFFRNTTNIGSTGFDNLTTRGVYGNSSESSGQPFDNNAGTIIHLDGRDSNYKSQIFQYSDGGDLYVRGKHGSSASWSGWRKVWHQGNDGAGSGLDADSLDGSTWATADKTVRWTGGGHHGNPRSMAIGYSGGNYGQFGYGIEYTSTSGSHNYAINDVVTRVDMYGGLIVYGAASGSVGSSISWTETFRARYTDAAPTFKTNTIWHQGNDGPGSGLNADTVDGIQGASLLRSDAQDAYTPKRIDFGASNNWDAVGFSNLTNLHVQGHNYFWFGAGNGTWFEGTANTKSSTSGLAADAGAAHDTLITTMSSTSYYDRGITFAVDSTGAGNDGWRLGKWHASNSQASSKLTVDGGLHVRGGQMANFDYYADDYSTYWDNQAGQAYWGGDTGWIDPSITAGHAIQIQAGNQATNSNNPALQFHQYGYGGIQMRYEGPNDYFHIESTGSDRYDWLRNKTDHGWIDIGPANTSWAHIYTDRPGFYFNKTSFQLLGNQVWHEGNDGSGSGLDADKLDGQQNTQFFRSQSGGTGSSIDTYTDNGFRTLQYTGYSSILWSNNQGGSTGTVQLEFEYNTPARGFKVRNKTDNSTWSSVGYVAMTTTNQGHISGTIWRSTNDGAGTGLDADLLDGLQGDSYLRSDTSDVMSGELNVSRNSGVTGTSAPNYDQVNIEMQTSSNHVPAISFHRGGYSATTLYEYSGELYVNAWTTRAQTGKLLSTGNEGSGGGIDADTVDGIHANAFLRTTNSPGTPGPGNQYTNISIGDSGTSYAYVQSHGSKPLKINPSGNTVDIDGGGTVTIDGPLHMANTRQISFDRGNSDFSTQVYASNHPPAGYTSTSHNYWVTLSSKGGTHVIVNTDGAYNSSENAYDHFTIWQDNISNYNARQFYVTNVGNVYAKGDVTAFQSSNMSDIRLKKDVKPIENALDIVDKLNGVTFTWKRDDKKSLGFIAQDVEKVVPELVEDKPAIDDPDTLHKTVNYANMVAILTEAVKELKAEVEELKNKKCNCNGSTK